MALGHKDGSLSLLDVDKGEVVPQPFALDQDSQEGSVCSWAGASGEAVLTLLSHATCLLPAEWRALERRS